jgi:aryl-alcohol dehydrogenase-like predicted oxidoreductase
VTRVDTERGNANLVKKRRLGRTGLQVCEVGFGGAGVGHAWGTTTDNECVRAVRCALDLGIDFFDTSPVYGAGKSEENLGAGLAGRRDKIVLATKVRLQTEEERGDMAPAIRRSAEASLRRLRTDYVDILQIHHQVGDARGRYLAVADPPRYALRLSTEDGLAFAAAARDLIGEGKVRFLGITAWDGDRLAIEALLASGAFDTAQILYNMLNQSAGSAPPPGFDDIDQGRALKSAEVHDIGVIGIRSHAAGALVDRLDRDVKPGSDVARDHRRAQKLAFLNKPPFRTLSEVALRFCLDNPAVATVVPGFKNAAEVEEAVACANLPSIADWDVAELQRLYARQFRP